jgi:Carboxypeptidase regulatory-like domain
MRSLRLRIPAVAFCLLVLTLIFSAVTRAQDKASITGIVTDPSGAVIPNANVVLVNTATNVSFSAVSNAIGSYLIPGVPPGPGYKITFSAAGFRPLTVTDLYMNVNATRTQNAALQVGGTLQTVEVSASNQTITLNTTDATVGNNLPVQYLYDLPVQVRDNPTALFYAQPGTTLSGSVTGARVDQSSVTVDGLDVNDSATGQFGAIIATAPVDSVQEFRGVTAGQQASAGEGGGGQYVLVTKSGTNSLHGNLNWYHRDTVTAANSWFSNNTTPKVPRAQLIRNQYGGNLGGPIVIPHVFHGQDKAFFFFDWFGQRIAQGTAVERTVPIGTSSTLYKGGFVSYQNSAGGVTTLTASQLNALDPLHIGFNSNVASVFSSRYPVPNDLTGAYGDHINTAGFRFNASTPTNEDVFIGKIDYNLTSNQRIWGRGTVQRFQNILNPIQFPGDPQTWPRINRSRAWVVGHNWTIGNNKSNQVSFGETVTDLNFPDLFNPTGVNQYSFGGTGTGSVILTAPYGSASNAQGRTYPIPVLRDDFAWQKGRHAIQFGGTFKYVNPSSYTILNYNAPLLGLGGYMTGGNASLRPTDIAATSTARARFDRAFALALGRVASISATFNYNAQRNVVAQGAGSTSNYRYYETELYFGDTWKVTPTISIDYGLRWQNYSVPYEKNGIESLPSLNFDQYFNARVAQSKAGQSGNSAVPFINYVLGGKANNGPGYFSPIYKNFAPRVALAYNPSFSKGTVISGGAGIIFDHTVVNAVQYQASQYSYLFQLPANLPHGTTGDPVASLTNDPRFGGFSAPPAGPTAPAALPVPYTPYVTNGVPGGLINGGAFNEGVTNNLKTPYNIMFNFGVQHEFPQGFLLKATYVGRLGRRLLAQADANQLIDFADAKSGQMMSTAFANIANQMRATGTVTPQPWFENLLPAHLGTNNGFNNNTELVAYDLDPLPYRGDFADTVQYLSTLGLPPNVGMGSQFSEDTYYTNMGFSSYNGLLITLHKNPGHGIQFDLNYTWSHSIDNVSLIANQGATGGYGFVCDVLRPDACRGNSDFDVTHYLNGNLIWELPFGRGRQFAATVPLWANEVIGGWNLSGMPYWHTGNTFFANSNAFVAGYANNAPAILTGKISDFASHVHKDATGTVWAFKASDDSLVNEFVGPVGFQIGSRNNLRGPNYFNLDLGLGKTFPIHENLRLLFRCDAYNSLNHPSFNIPSNPGADDFTHMDITESSGTFGVVTSTASTARVLQGSLRLEF